MTDKKMEATSDVIGYNPQLLLTDQSTIFSWVRAAFPDPWLAGYMNNIFAYDLFIDDEIVFDHPPTGRKPLRQRFESEMEEAMTTAKWSEIGSPMDQVERYRKEIRNPWPHKVAVLKVSDIDYSLLEARILSLYADRRACGVILDMEAAGGDIWNPQLELYAQAYHFAEKPNRSETVEPKSKREYLKHDPSKRRPTWRKTRR